MDFDHNAKSSIGNFFTVILPLTEFPTSDRGWKNVRRDSEEA
jgi:hypothetical protein